MDKQELETKQKAFAAGIVSVVYAFVLQITKGLVLFPNQPSNVDFISVFVPAIASILFGKVIGAAGAAGEERAGAVGVSVSGADRGPGAGGGLPPYPAAAVGTDLHR